MRTQDLVGVCSYLQRRVATAKPVLDVPHVPISTALVLAAGNGDRFQAGRRRSKLLEPILGQPLILRTLQTARDAGITRAVLVLGYEADSLRSVIERHAPDGLEVHFSYNPEWHLENGVSVLAARERLLTSRFALLMGDHLFSAPMLTQLLREPMAPTESALAIDSRPAPPDVAEEATKVRLSGSRIVAIGKDLAVYDALDTGLFVCAPPLFAALVESREAGDTTLSGGIRRLAARGLMRGVDVGNAVWHDIDTRADLAAARALLHEAAAPLLRHTGAAAPLLRDTEAAAPLLRDTEAAAPLRRDTEAAAPLLGAEPQPA
jgi:choline kinase